MTPREPTYAGSLLVATPLITLPPFKKAVIFLSEHDESGAVGVILNAPSQLSVADVLPDLAPLASPPAVVHVGGPVQTDSAVVLAQATSLDFARGTALTDVGIIDPSDPPPDASNLRVYAGFSGWDAGQLEDEMTEGSWWVVPAAAQDVFAAETIDMWQRCVRRLKGRQSLYATYPDDPLTN